MMLVLARIQRRHERADVNYERDRRVCLSS